MISLLAPFEAKAQLKSFLIGSSITIARAFYHNEHAITDALETGRVRLVVPSKEWLCATELRKKFEWQDVMESGVASLNGVFKLLSRNASNVAAVHEEQTSRLIAKHRKAKVPFSYLNKVLFGAVIVSKELDEARFQMLHRAAHLLHDHGFNDLLRFRMRGSVEANNFAIDETGERTWNPIKLDQLKIILPACLAVNLAIHAVVEKFS